MISPPIIFPNTFTIAINIEKIILNLKSKSKISAKFVKNISILIISTTYYCTYFC